jgi:deoxyuridine 5'-triphosphate nucleotidohydrolase
MKSFENIDDEHKAYVLGWIAKDPVANEGDVEVRGHYITILPIARSLEMSDEQVLTKNSHHFFTLPGDHLRTHMRSHSWIDETKDDSILWAYVNGVYDRYGESAWEVDQPVCTLPDIPPVGGVVCKRLGVPADRKGNKLTIAGSNCIDFLGKMYAARGRNSACMILKRDAYIRCLSTYEPSMFTLPLCKVHVMDKGAVVPSKAQPSDVGYDLTVIREHKRLLGNVVLYDTGISLKVHHGFYAEVVPRSSLVKSGYMLANSVGIIDPSYTGNILVALVKVCDDAPEIKLPFRCCQLVFRRQVHVEVRAVNDAQDDTVRGDGGFGSSG